MVPGVKRSTRIAFSVSAFISLGYDHRLVNGADGDQFLARIKQLMENFPDEA
jgi:pyruvate/2-oxoglutarate dehydrogenase complex dihydrolipoamide acyltransferase (E2) component